MSIDQLPPEILARTFSFSVFEIALSLPVAARLHNGAFTESAVRFGSTIRFSWRILVFTGDDRLTDYQLSQLLVRINAREITKELNLSLVSHIHGQGLAPLRHSRVLERIDLVGTGAEKNPMPILQTLRTMIPYALHEVILIS